MWPGTSPLAAVNAAAKMVVAALIIVALYAGRDLLIPLSLAALLSFVLHPGAKAGAVGVSARHRRGLGHGRFARRAQFGSHGYRTTSGARYE